MERTKLPISFPSTNNKPCRFPIKLTMIQLKGGPKCLVLAHCAIWSWPNPAPPKKGSRPKTLPQLKKKNNSNTPCSLALSCTQQQFPFSPLATPTVSLSSGFQTRLSPHAIGFLFLFPSYSLTSI